MSNLGQKSQYPINYSCDTCKCDKQPHLVVQVFCFHDYQHIEGLEAELTMSKNVILRKTRSKFQSQLKN